MHLRRRTLPLLLAGLGASQAWAYDFTGADGDLKGSWVSNVTAGAGVRLRSPSCSLTGDPGALGCGASANTAQWGAGDDGDLNYRKGQAFTESLSATSELLLKMPGQGLKFMGRVTAMVDFAADRTERTRLSPSAANQVVHSAQLLDLWAEKDFELDDHSAHLRLGNQVINWGESMYSMGGINATNSLDIQKLLVPGTQLKQALLPAPMLSFATGLAHGLAVEAYYQTRWNENRLPPVGSYWSVSNVVGRGIEPYTVSTTNFNAQGYSAGTIAGASSKNRDAIAAVTEGLLEGAYAGDGVYEDFALPISRRAPSKHKGQFGLKLAYASPSSSTNVAFYYENYTDKSPVLSSKADGSLQWSYLEHRQLFGLSTNFGLGDWAIGAELSYRPRDAVSLSSCFGAGGPTDINTNGIAGIDCQQWVDRKKWQLGVNGLLALTPTDYPFLKWIGADAATFVAELNWIYYPGLTAGGVSRVVGGQSVTQVPATGYLNWLNRNASQGYPIVAAQGTASSIGGTFDFNWTYDGSLIPGWQVTPGITFAPSLKGYTPTFLANYMQGMKSTNVYVLFNQNPAVWQAGVNFTKFSGGHQSVGQPYADRDFIGVFVTRNF